MNDALQPATRRACLFLVFLSGWVLGAPVSRQAADRAAAGWLKQYPAPMEKHFSGSLGRTKAVTDAEGRILYYVMHLEPQGFIVMSADNRIEPVISFSSSGYYDGDENNPLTTMLKKDMTGRLAIVRRKEHDKNTAEKKMHKWQLLLDAGQQKKTEEYEASATSVASISEVWVDPFVHTRWDQSDVWGSPCYNYYTPNNYPTGCVATAMAQVMRYHSWPQTGIGTKSFQIYVNGSSQWASTRGGNGSGGAYNWDQMPYDPQSGVTTTQRQAMGALCYDAGVTVNMSYWSDGSSASLVDADQELTATFKYSNSIYTRSLSSYGDSCLWNILNANLDAQLPVILGVSRTGGGHAVVADGYGYHDGTLYHHINMGWGGADNTWYNLPLIDAYYVYTVIDECIYNIYTSGTGEIISGRVTNLAGAPLAGVAVRAYIGGSLHKQTVTNARGVYALKNLSSNTTYRISAEKTGESFPDQYVTTGSSTDWSIPGNRSGILFVSANAGPPSAFDIETNVDSTDTVNIQLLALDDGDPDPNFLHYIITALPSHGTLSEPNVGSIDAVPYIIMASDANGVNYAPCPYFGGQDTFTYKANDGGIYPTGGDSNIASVTVNVQNKKTTDFHSDSNSYSHGMLDTTDYAVRSQMIYLSGEMGAAKRITDLAIRVDSVPGRTLSNWTIRMRHTTLSVYSSLQQIFSDWTTVYQANQTLAFGWNWFHFNTPFDYNGSSNLMIDISFWNTGTASDGYYYIYNVGQNRNYIMFDSDGDAGNPLNWGYYSYWDYYSQNAYMPVMQFISETPIEPLVGDFDATCTVKLPDLMRLAAAWNTQLGQAHYDPACDMSVPKDNTIDLLDLLVFAEHWLQRYAP